MDKHIGFVGALSIGLGGLSILIGLTLMVAVVVSGALAINEPTARTIVFIVGPVIGGIITLVALTGVIGGIGLLKRKTWGRVWTMVYAVLSLFSIPIGTAFGVYALWVLMHEDTLSILRRGPDAGAASDMQIPLDRAA